MQNINTDHLIPLVEERNVLWDQTLQIYKNKQLTMTAWREIFCELNPDFLEMQQKERHEFGKMVIKRWTHIRDSWMKSYKKRINKKKSGSLGRISRPYVYHEQMLFLKKITERRKSFNFAHKKSNIRTVTHQANGEVTDHQAVVPNQSKHADELPKFETCVSETNAEVTSEHLPEPSVERNKTIHVDQLNTNQPFLLPHLTVEADKIPKVEPHVSEPNLEVTSEHSLEPRAKRQKTNYLDSRMTQFLYSRLKSDDNNRHLSFFRGILPSLDSFNDEDTLEFQSGILSLIQNIKRKQQHQYFNPAFTHLNSNNNMNDWQHRPGFSNHQVQHNLNQTPDTMPSTSGYFTQQFQKSQEVGMPVPSPQSISTEDSSTEFNFDYDDF